MGDFSKVHGSMPYFRKKWPFMAMQAASPRLSADIGTRLETLTMKCASRALP